jgi:DNA-directed RNA polymerase alpha subunit
MKQMPMAFYEVREGPIPGLRLPLNAWKVLRRENITSLDQLRAVAEEIERFEGIGRKTAQAIRAELTRLAASDGQPPDKGQP